jgi:large subunit ribosomal protein L7e
MPFGADAPSHAGPHRAPHTGCGSVGVGLWALPNPHSDKNHHWSGARLSHLLCFAFGHPLSFLTWFFALFGVSLSLFSLSLSLSLSSLFSLSLSLSLSLSFSFPSPLSSKKAAPKKAAAPKQAAAATTRAAGAPASIPESFLKKRKTTEEVQARRDARLVKQKKANKAARKETFKRAEKYVKEYRQIERDTIRYKRQAKNNGNLYVEPAAKVLLVVRIRGINSMAPKTKKILQLLRLRQVNNAVLVRVNKATENMLVQVTPYITYGPPTVKTISDLVYKRGYGKVNRQRIPLTENKIIAGELSSKNIICIEDLIHELATCGPNFKEANNFLWPFKLSSPLGGWSYKKTHYSEGGDAGNREEDINKLVRRMN